MATMRSSTGVVPFTGATNPARDSPKHLGRDSLTAVAARSVPVHKYPAPRNKTLPLPSPPNSISPNLPPYGLKTRSASTLTTGSAPVAHTHLDAIDSDIDLQDSSSRKEGPATSEVTDPITPALLAKQYLPEILLNHGPLAIRHITGYLMASVPGFSSVPPAKARRLVVGALEGRGGGGEKGVRNESVRFEKVGWGQWTAKPQVVVQDTGNLLAKMKPSTSVASIAINHAASRQRTDVSAQSWQGSSDPFARDGHADIFDVDRMSLDDDDDDDNSCSSSDAPDDDMMDMEMDGNDEDEDDDTDEEDWKTIGAAGLRQLSYTGATGLGGSTFRGSQGGGAFGGGTFSKSAPLRSGMIRQPRPQNFNYAAFGMTNPPAEQEREAIEALLRLGSA